VLAGGCAQNLGIKDRPPSNFAVGGTATGVLGSVVIELRIDGDSELLAVTQEGAFRFATRLETGASYTVVLVDPGLPCTLRNQTGVITGADAAIELTCTGASQLAKYAARRRTPAPTTSSATAWRSRVIPSRSGPATRPAAQGVGGNQADNTAQESGAVYVFRRSGTAWLQEAYLQASNTGAVDEFGSSVALSGDTLAVGAPDEDSAAQGVGGNQADNSATRSGAVYVFH
jgi:hypothetical protein